jgi:amino acid transporter
MSPSAPLDDTPMEVPLKYHTFASPMSYFGGLLDLPHRLKYRFAATWTPQQETSIVKSRSGVAMKATLVWYDMMFFGIGAMVGAGIFVSTGVIANGYAGPAVVVSYIVSGISAMLSALCYSEFAIQVPTAGGAFTYLRITLGEFASFFTAGNLIMEYVLSGAAVARGFTSYFCTVFGNTDTNAWRIYVPSFANDFQYLDPIAFSLIVVLTVLLCWGSKESAWTNLITTIVHLILIAFIVVLAFIKGNSWNLTNSGVDGLANGYFPFGSQGVFNGAAQAYFSYIGFDAVATLAEECKSPETSIPIGIIGSVGITIVLYCLLSFSLTFLQPYGLIDQNAPFSTAFQSFGMQWAATIVGLGATLGTITSTMMSLLGQARYLTMIGRSHLIPFWFAKVNSYTKTPINATIVLSFCSAVLALFTGLDMLINMVSIGTLFVFFMVANALIFRRHYVKGQNSPWLPLCYLFLFSGIAIAFSTVYWAAYSMWYLMLTFAILAFVLTGLFSLICKQQYHPDKWHVPLSPWLPAFSVFLNVFLLGSLDTQSYKNFGCFSAGLVGIYLFYSVHATWDLEGEGLDDESVSKQKLVYDGSMSRTDTESGSGMEAEMAMTKNVD